MGIATLITSNWSQEGARSAKFTPPWVAGGKAKYAGDAAFIVGGSTSTGQYGAYHPFDTLALQVS